MPVDTSQPGKLQQIPGPFAKGRAAGRARISFSFGSHQDLTLLTAESGLAIRLQALLLSDAGCHATLPLAAASAIVVNRAAPSFQ